MSRTAPRAHLTSSLLRPSGWLVANVCLAHASHVAPRGSGVERDETAVAPPFYAKRVPTRATPAEGLRSPYGSALKFSLRLSAQRRIAMKLAARYLRQSCQAFLTEALERHIERIARQPGNEILLFDLQAEAAR